MTPPPPPPHTIEKHRMGGHRTTITNKLRKKNMPQLEPQTMLPTSRARALKKLGLTEEDVHLSKKLFSEISSSAKTPSAKTPCNSTKAERLLGYNATRLKRAKALRLLGATEDDVELECAKNLGSLGQGARRRSFVMEMDKGRRSSRLHRRLSLGNTQRRTFFGRGRSRASSRRKKETSGGERRDRSKTLPHSRRRRGSSSSLSSCGGGSMSRRYTQ